MIGSRKLENFSVVVNSNVLCRILEIFTFIICFGLFFYLMMDTWEKFSTEMTSTGVRQVEMENLSLPCLTICPWAAFKQRGFHFTTEAYLNNTYNRIELFNASSNILDPSLCQIDELKSPFYGRCYMICCTLKKMDQKDRMLIPFLRNRDINVYVHDKDDKMWLNFNPPPIEITSILLHLHPDIVSIDISANIKKTTIMNKPPKSPCKVYKNKEDYITCSKIYIYSYLEENLNCIFAGTEDLFDNKTNIKECNGKKSASKAYYSLVNLTYLDKRQDMITACPIPCTQTFYKLETRFFHNNTWIDPENQYPDLSGQEYFLTFHYASLMAEERVEALIYDIGSFLAAAGGNLGLFLGFSCLTMLLNLYQFCKSFFFEQFQRKTLCSD